MIVTVSYGGSLSLCTRQCAPRASLDPTLEGAATTNIESHPLFTVFRAALARERDVVPSPPQPPLFEWGGAFAYHAKAVFHGWKSESRAKGDARGDAVVPIGCPLAQGGFCDLGPQQHADPFSQC